MQSRRIAPPPPSRAPRHHFIGVSELQTNPEWTIDAVAPECLIDTPLVDRNG
jgi:hypothetical protein